ncbi:DUF4422 domain-containing protein, partial [Escherichia coli]|nr:DUF4422 domain-containing protein [Escherichia coli]
INAEYESQFGLSDESISTCVDGYDLLLPKKWSVTSAGSKNNLDHYAKGEFLHIKDYQSALDVVEELYPQYKAAIQQF